MCCAGMAIDTDGGKPLAIKDAGPEIIRHRVAVGTGRPKAGSVATGPA